MHPNRWPVMSQLPICIASVLDWIIRERQPLQIPVPLQATPIDTPMSVDEMPTPWFESQDNDSDHGPLASPHECIVVFKHELSDPVKFVVTTPCTVHDMLQAHIKLVGDFQVIQVCNQHGVALPMAHEMQLGEVFFVWCENSSADLPTHAAASVVEGQRPGDFAADDDGMHDESHAYAPRPVVSPTIAWTQPIQDPAENVSPLLHDVGECETPDRILADTDSWISAAPLLGLCDEQFTTLQPPQVQSLKHLWSLRHQFLRATDRTLILSNQHGVWADDEFRFHMANLVKAFNNCQCTQGSGNVKSCTVLDPLLITGWLHHGHQACSDWGASHPEIQKKGGLLISACMVEKHWVPVVMKPVGVRLHITTWDSPDHDHSKLIVLLEAIGQALGFSQVIMERHHRLFFSSDKCGAMAMTDLHHALLGVMLPTGSDEVVVLHDRFRQAFTAAVAEAQLAHRPWVWGAGDQHPVPMELPSSSQSEISRDPSTNMSASHQCISKESRMDLLREKGKMWGDDEVRYHLLHLLRHQDTVRHAQTTNVPGFVMMDPLLLSTWDSVGKVMCETWCKTNPAVARGHHIVAVFLHNDHWFPVWCVPRSNVMVVHKLADPLVPDDLLFPMAHVLKQSLGFQEVVLHTIPNPLPSNNLCGAAAVAFIGHLLVGAPLPTTVQELNTLHSNMKASFVDALFKGKCCICPVAWGSGPIGALLKPLTEELLKHGVPESKVDQRAQQAIKALGSDNVAIALKSKNVWRSLKTMGNNVKFQFLLPDELDAVISSNKGLPVGKRTKLKLPQTKPTMPESIDPAKLAIIDGTLRCQGAVVPQIACQQIGPVSRGVVLISLEEASPYLRAGKPVSNEPLALAVLVPPGSDITTALPHTKVMLPCTCVANREPLLVETWIVQLGSGLVEKHVVSQAIALDQLDVVSVKALVYRDEFTGKWDEFISSPIKHVVHFLPLLKRCHDTACNCECWHNPEGLAVKEPLMDVWRRQFLSSGFKQTPAQKSDIFSMCLRIPAVLLEGLLSKSGQAGIYLEPRSPDGKEVLSEYSVIWSSKMNASEMAHTKQTNPAIIGFARLNDRRGFRVLQSQAQAVHDLVHPEPTFLPSGPKSQFVGGPFPWGSDRHAIARALKQTGWSVKVLQPTQPIPGRGSMWLLQSVDDPPETILHTTHGEVVISKHKEVPVARSVSISTVGSASTLSLCGSAHAGGG